MTPLLEQLRDISRQPQGPTYKALHELCAEAADEIERLTAIANTDTPELEEQHAEIERLQALLQASESLKRGYLDENERLQADRQTVYEWMREPDYVENANLEWLTEWINRRPLASAHVQDGSDKS